MQADGILFPHLHKALNVSRNFNTHQINMTDYLYPILSLIALLILFHVFFIKLFPQSKIFWKKVDYWWVSLGIIGIIGATFSYKREVASAWTPWHKKVLKDVYSEFKSGLHQQLADFSDSSGYYLSMAKNPIQKRKFISSGKFFGTLFRKVDSCEKLIINEEQYDLVDSVTKEYKAFIDSVNDRLVVDVSSSVTFMSERSKEEATTLLNLRQQENRDTLNWILLLVSPYLFAVAIAIRLTKVTAEIKEIK